MMNPRKKTLTIILTTALFSSAWASETANVSGEIIDLFGSQSPKMTEQVSTPSASVTSQEKKQAVAAPTKQSSTVAIAPTDRTIKNSIKNESGPIRPSAKRSKELTSSTEQAIATKAPVRGEQFTLSLEPKKINYTLPTSIEKPQVELLSLDGQVLSSQTHSGKDIGGAIDTTSLAKGHYILRIVDENDTKSCLTRAVTINR